MRLNISRPSQLVPNIQFSRINERLGPNQHVGARHCKTGWGAESGSGRRWDDSGQPPGAAPGLFRRTVDAETRREQQLRDLLQHIAHLATIRPSTSIRQNISEEAIPAYGATLKITWVHALLI